MSDYLTIAQVRALNEVADATKQLIENTTEGYPYTVVAVARLARISIALEVCDGLNIDPDQAHSIADQAGITPRWIDRLGDDDVQAEADRKITAAADHQFRGGAAA
jgi:hypothetical protein